MKPSYTNMIGIWLTYIYFLDSMMSWGWLQTSILIWLDNICVYTRSPGWSVNFYPLVGIMGKPILQESQNTQRLDPPRYQDMAHMALARPTWCYDPGHGMAWQQASGPTCREHFPCSNLGNTCDFNGELGGCWVDHAPSDGWGFWFHKRNIA